MFYQMDYYLLPSLVALQNQLAVELDKFMAVIRTSLRQFRQHLDETLQMLRDSNARFIKSFKWVFALYQSEDGCG